MFDGSRIERGSVVWDATKAAEFMSAPGGVIYGYLPKGRTFPVLASFERPTPEDGCRSEHWGGVIPGSGFQVGHYRWESGLTWLLLRRVRWPTVEGREPWSPGLWQRIAPVATLPGYSPTRSIRARIAAWWADRQPATCRSEPTA